MRTRAVWLVGFILAAAATVRAQAPVVVGTVRTAEGGLGLPYGVVAIPAINREAFTNDQGGFTLRELPEGTLTLRFRHIGFTPRDTSVTLHQGDTLRFTVTLARLAIRLDAMRVVGHRFALAAGCPSTNDPAEADALNQLLGQVEENASQQRLLMKSNPYSQQMAHVSVARHDDGQIDMGEESYFVLEARPKAAYQPRKVFRTKNGAMTMAIPELQDFADSVFIANHCFTYGGISGDSVRFIKLDFFPVGQLKDPDIEGTVTLAADTYGISTVEMRTTGVPRSRGNPITSIRVVSEFKDVLPGLGVLSRVESFIAMTGEKDDKGKSVASHGEVQQLVRIIWKKGPP